MAHYHHCGGCDVEWEGKDPACWNCGEEGAEGKDTSIPWRNAWSSIQPFPYAWRNETN